MRPQTIVERLDFVAKRIPGLKFTPPTQLTSKPGDDQGYGCFMSCDMYYIEIKVDQSHQTVKDVVISHGNNAEGISCPVLRKVLADQDFETFARHLSGLHSIYQISTNDKKVKQRAYPALTALETDLTILSEIQRRRTNNNCHDLIHKSPIGIMEPRQGGLPVRLTYFVTPYDLVDTNQGGFINLTINNIIDKNLGLSATVEIEGSSPHKLQVKSLINAPLNSSLPAYAAFNPSNSEKLPAQFVLKLSQPLPMLNTSINQIVSEINEPSTIKEFLTALTSSGKESIISLIARHELDLNKGPFGRSVDTLRSDSESCDLKRHVFSVKLLDDYHTYHIIDTYLEKPEGVYVKKIPFTHPTSIPIILRVLRQQALLNFVIGSCIRRNRSNFSGNNNDNSAVPTASKESNMFDVMPISLSSACIAFEHPSKESLASLEIDFKDLSCQLHALEKESVCSNEFVTKVFQRCWSLPITLRSVLKKCEEKRLASLEDASKRRERELHELLTNSSNQQAPQINTDVKNRDTLLQSKFDSLNEKSKSRDLNAMAEFLNSELNSASTSESSSNHLQNAKHTDQSGDRSDLLKKFSCKPKVAKQNTTAKSQSGSKILSLMLKRNNPTSSSADDASLKATLTKKVKTKMNESNLKNSPLTTTKLISPEMTAPPRISNKQSKQNLQNVSLSIISGSNPTGSKNQPMPHHLMMANQTMTVGLNLAPQGSSSSLKQPELATININNVAMNNMKIKPTQPNGSSNNNNNSNNSLKQARKSSVGVVLDKLVGNLNQLDSPNLVSSQTSSDATIEKNYEISRGSPSGSKSKSRPPNDQFAIKQGSPGGLKLTVTKTKPTATPPSAASVAASVGSTSTGTSIVASTTAPASATSASSSNSSNATSSSFTPKSNLNKILDSTSSTPSIKYTIPKISKNQSSSSSNQQAANQTDSSNPASNIASQSTETPTVATNSTSSSTPKRAAPAAFNRANNNNRNPVSSSTHPLGRTTSNPLAGANSRASSSSSISSSNQQHSGVRQQPMNRPQQQQQPINQQRPTSLNQQLNQPPMFVLNQPQQLPSKPNSFAPNVDINLLAATQVAMLNAQQRQNQPIKAPGFMASSADAHAISSSKQQFASNSAATPMATNSTAIVNSGPQFYVKQPMFENQGPGAVSSTPRMNAFEISQSFISSNQPKPMQPALQHRAPVALNFQMNSIAPVAKIPSAPSSSITSSGNDNQLQANQGVSSSSDSGSNRNVDPTISTPSSPTECVQEETAQPPALIPIDSLDEPQATSPDTESHPDDASDRLSIVDTNETLADSLSATNTPKPSCRSDVSSPVAGASESTTAAISSSQSTDRSDPANFSRDSITGLSGFDGGASVLASTRDNAFPLVSASTATTSTASTTFNDLPSANSSLVSQSSLALDEDGCGTTAMSSSSTARRPPLPSSATSSITIPSSDSETIAPQSTMTATSNLL